MVYIRIYLPETCIFFTINEQFTAMMINYLTVYSNLRGLQFKHILEIQCFIVDYPPFFPNRNNSGLFEICNLSQHGLKAEVQSAQSICSVYTTPEHF